MPTISYITDNSIPVMDYWWPRLLDAQRFLHLLKLVYPGKFDYYMACRAHFGKEIRSHRSHGILFEENMLAEVDPNSKILVCHMGGKLRMSYLTDIELFPGARWVRILRPYPGRTYP